MDKWTKKADMPTARGYLSTSVINGKVYAIGGWNLLSRDKPLSIMEEYDSKTDKWTKKADMPMARADFSTSAMNGKIYAIGGSKVSLSLPLSIVEEYDTGFAAEEEKSVDAKGKLPASWGKIKAGY